MKQPEVLTPKQAAELLQLNEETVRRLLRSGQLPGCKLGPRQWRIRRGDLQDYLCRGRVEAVRSEAS